MKKRLHIKMNAPAVLGFSALCLLAYALNYLTHGGSNRVLFSVYRGSLLNPLTYLRCITHVFGHASWSHLFGNLMYILILGPILEEKYGTSNMIFVMLATAIVTAAANLIFFPFVRMMGASGIVFALILLSSITNFSDDSIPVTLILVAVLYIGREFYEAFFVTDNISHLAHIVGGLVGAFLGFVMNRNHMSRYR